MLMEVWQDKFSALNFALMLCLVMKCATVAANEQDLISLLDKVEASLSTNPKLAENLVAQAKERISQSQSPSQSLLKHKPRLLNLQAHLYILSSEFSKAFAYAIDAQRLAEEVDNPLQRAESLRRQGIINGFFELDSDALDLLTQSLRIHQKLDSKYVLNNLQSIANIYARNDAWADSLIDIGEQLVAESIARNNPYFEQQGYSFIASGLIKNGNHQKASELVRHVQVTLQQSGAINYYGALAHLQMGQLPEAMHNIEVYQNFAQQRNIPVYIVAGDLLESKILLALKEDTIGLQMLLRAYDLAKEKQLLDYQRDALMMLSELYREQGNYQKAFDYQAEYIQLKEATFDSTQSERVAFSRARLELEQKVQKIIELQHDAQVSEQQTRFQTSAIILAFSVAVLMVGLYLRLVRHKRLLQSYSSQLKSANEAKSSFLARMSHEIRTPINAIIGLTRLTQQQKLTKPQQNLNLQQIEESSYTLLGVINDILDFSKIEAGKLNIDSVPFELDKVVDQAIRLQTLKAHEKGLELVQYIARDVPLYLKGDALRVQQVLNNLISNAVKFTSRGMVSVSVTKKYSSADVVLEFAVKDTGIGLTEEQISRLFNSFAQADETTTRKFGGTGLGLAICKQLAELMGGEIRVESQPDVGSTFYFSIKVEAAEVAHSDQLVPGMALSDLRVLVVDDLDMCRRAAAEVLLRANVNPDLVDSGAKAIDKVRLSMQDKAPYDLVLLDWQMPDVDGIQVASIINLEFPHSKPTIAMLSAYDINELQELGKPLGIRNYIEKPINTSKLLELITRVSHETTPKLKTEIASSPETEKHIPNLGRCHILLVEDNDLNRKVATGYLSETQAKITVAEDGQIAVDILSKKLDDFDLVLMDVQMPVMDGLKATQIIRRDLHLSLPVVAMTANAMTGDIDKCLAVGMNAHIAKPIEPALLYQKLADILAHKLNPERENPLQGNASSPEVVNKTCIHPPSTHKHSPPDLTNKRVLLVEDNKLNRKAAVSLLAETQAHLTVAKDGVMALRQMQGKVFDLVFMDIQMPNMDGITTTQKIRQELGISTPVIAMTASIANADIETMLNNGMDAYVTKPIDSGALYAVINEILCQDTAVKKTTTTDNLDETMGPELIKLTQIDKARAIAKLHGKADMYDGLVKDFVDMQDHISQLETALEENDIANIKLLVHTYKSGLSYVGAYALATLGKQLDASFTSDERDLSPELVNRLRLYIKAISQVTESFKSNL